MNNNDTIFALSSGHGKSGVAVVRISGQGLADVFAGIINKSEFKNRYAYFVNLRDGAGELIDQCLAMFFPAPHSFTGEDVIELHTHGAPAVVQAVFDYLVTLGMRMAEPGEFSRRAFYNNKMDLADVDGLAALLDAQTDKQRKSALRSMLGHDSAVYEGWRAQMVEISAYAAAMLDYSPDDLPANIGDKIQSKARELYDDINVSLSRYAAARAVRSGFNITLAGETNVGKSSLFNYLVGANRAIVSDVAGTTRDVVSAQMDIDGYLVNLNDTAGLRETDDKIESIGIQRTHDEIKNADIIIRVYVSDQNIDAGADNEIVVVNKSDLGARSDKTGVIYTSAKTGMGMDVLLGAIQEKMHALLDGTDACVVINARTKTLLESARDELHGAIAAGDNYDIFAEHTRRAAESIGKILGTITASEILDATFGQLCLGK